ncbi:Cupredoxin [Lactarius quietus]|nr:Cupredoxin [Lactarius quietus]
MTIIEVDGVNHRPLVVGSFKIFAGIRAVPNIGNRDFTGLTNLAILRYQGADPGKSSDPTQNIPSSVLPLKETYLHPLVTTPLPGKPVPGGADINVHLNVALNDNFTKFLVNGDSFESEGSILLQVLNEVPASKLLPSGSIYPVGSKKSVEATFPGGAGGINTGGEHPVHWHGHDFHAVRSAGNSAYNFVNPVIRDVVSVGNTGDSVTIRFMTDGPGPLFLHCYIDWHLEKGFAVVFAEDVPDVSTTVHPTGEPGSERVTACNQILTNTRSSAAGWNDLGSNYNNFTNLSALTVLSATWLGISVISVTSR